MEARDLLLYMFQRLIVSLVSVCLTGKINPFSSYQKAFLRTFASKSTPLENTAMMLKHKLSCYDKDELFTLGQVAVMEAIIRCETNLASTIVYCFKEQITQTIKDKVPTTHTDYETLDHSIDLEDDTLLAIFISQQTPEHQEIIESVLAGEKVKIPDKLKSILSSYLRP
jgi:hypothetical protein